MNKAEQIAQFLLERGEAMTATDMYEAGFRYANGEETTPRLIGINLNKLHQSPNYSIECRHVRIANNRVNVVKVTAIHRGKNELIQN